MPLRNEPKSLLDSSLFTIACYFDSICYNCQSKSEIRKMMDDRTYLQIEGPFQHLPQTLRTGLQDALRSHFGSLRFKHLHPLMNPNQTEFSMYGVSEKDSTIDLLYRMCKRLKYLDLSYLCHVSPGIFIKLIPSLTNIVHLNLKMTEIVDQVIQLIGKHCTQLQYLNVSQCTLMKDALRHLCYNTEEKRRTELCTKLVKLDITGCRFTPDCLAYLISHVQTLTHLEYENLLDIFNVRRHEKDFGFPGSLIFQLNHLTANDGLVSVYNADVAVEHCPLASTVTITNCIVENEAMYAFMNLQNLQHLNLTNSDDLGIDFMEGVLPILMMCGSKLQTLLLAKFTNVDLNAIGRTCPNIRNLALSSVAAFEEIVAPNEEYFTKLNALELWTDNANETVDSHFLKQILTFCSDLKNLLISGARNLTDKLMFQIWKRNEMTELTRLTLQDCPQISKESIDAILESTNKLSTLRIWGCVLLPKSQSILIQKMIDEENFNLYFEWYAQ